ncbi:diacylglycerol kinase family lipid kinase [Neobacillus sp. PS3-34]|uniref:diacylglycerol/lipid kinase family protein n=1 Tax=Neobacillus sp. PS3-34 TaxID=3070678 RepID=UPI0027E1DB50|nr:diacylglycerol kinase family lipid kinase [Neobacillus sp. PS3-34]WML50213.1 diacylglycerol kinase family lipid kinase [Neobacillus sp. PS3-34]
MERNTKAMLIYNGNAGQKDIEKKLGACVPVFSAAFGHLLILRTERPQHAQQLCEEYGEAVDLVIVLGGDGTVHECVNGLGGLNKRPAIAILPGGTCNDFSRTLGTPLDIRAAAESIVSGEEVPVDVMRINNNFALNFCGVGLVTETSNNIDEREKALFGKISYYLSAFRTIRQMDPFSFSLQYDGEHAEGEAVMILVANGNHIGTNALPFNGIQYDDGLANVFIMKNTNLALLKDLLTTDVSAEDESRANEILHYSGRKITIETDKPRDADTDGEVYLQTPLEIEVLPGHFRMLKALNGQ